MLRRLEVRDPKMTDSDLDALFYQISQVPALSEVLLAHGTLSDRGVSVLARFLSHHPRVTHFALTDTTVRVVARC